MDDFAHDRYLAGLVDGEGCLTIVTTSGTAYTMMMSIGQRSDVGQVLYQLQRVFGGGVSDHKPRSGNLTTTWQVTAKRDILRLIEYFDEFHLIGKAPQYEVWRRAALLYYEHGAGKRTKGAAKKNPAWLIAEMNTALFELRDLKRLGTTWDRFWASSNQASPDFTT